MKKLLFSCCCCGIGNCCCGCCCDASSAPFPFPPPPGADALGDDGKLNSSISSSFYYDDDEEEEFSLLSVLFFGDVPTNGKMKKGRTKVIFIFRIFCFFSAEEKSGSRETWRDIFFEKRERPQSGNSRHSWLTPPLSYITHTISDLF